MNYFKPILHRFAEASDEVMSKLSTVDVLDQDMKHGTQLDNADAGDGTTMKLLITDIDSE